MYNLKLKNCVMGLAGLAMAFGVASCDSDNDPEVKDITGSDMWGEVLRGDNMSLQFYPDHFAYYWEYTFSAEENPETGLVIEGEFPDCDKKYVIYVLPMDAPEAISKGKKNIIWFDSDVKKVCTILRHYIPQGDIKGGVGMPLVKGIDLKTGEFTVAPERKLSGLRGEMEIPGGAFSSMDNMLFFRAPFSYAYPNGPAEYCYNRNVLEEDKVMVFNFKAPSFPKNPSEYGSVDMRYWSVCVGNQETYTPLAISDYQTKIDSDGFANYIMADKNSPKYAEVRAIAEKKGYNILEWDGKKWGDGVMILYRNMVFADDYAHSLRKLDPVGPGVNPMDNPQKYICVLALGQWGATGKKVSADEFIQADGQIQLRQQPAN